MKRYYLKLLVSDISNVRLEHFKDTKAVNDYLAGQRGSFWRSTSRDITTDTTNMIDDLKEISVRTARSVKERRVYYGAEDAAGDIVKLTKSELQQHFEDGSTVYLVHVVELKLSVPGDVSEQEVYSIVSAYDDFVELQS